MQAQTESTDSSAIVCVNKIISAREKSLLPTLHARE